MLYSKQNRRCYSYVEYTCVFLDLNRLREHGMNGSLIIHKMRDHCRQRKQLLWPRCYSQPQTPIQITVVRATELRGKTGAVWYSHNGRRENDVVLNPYVLLFRFFLDRNALQGANERLLKLLSDVVKQAASTEETINKQLEDLIQETSQNEEQLTQWPLESGTLHESQFPTDSIRRPEGSIFPGLLTSTPAAGPSAPTVNFATPAGGERTLW